MISEKVVIINNKNQEKLTILVESINLKRVMLCFDNTTQFNVREWREFGLHSVQKIQNIATGESLILGIQRIGGNLVVLKFSDDARYFEIDGSNHVNVSPSSK